MQDRAGSWPGRNRVSLEPGSFKDAFMHALRNADVAVTAASVRVLCGFLLNKSTDPDILDEAGEPLLCCLVV